MKAAALIILIALTVSMGAPLSVIPPHGDGKYLRTLDVCDAANPALSTNSTMPGIHVSPDIVMPAEFAGFTHQMDDVFHPLLITIQKDRPPQF
jgi:hypothetical protein